MLVMLQDMKTIVYLYLYVCKHIPSVHVYSMCVCMQMHLYLYMYLYIYIQIYLSLSSPLTITFMPASFSGTIDGQNTTSTLGEPATVRVNTCQGVSGGFDIRGIHSVPCSSNLETTRFDMIGLRSLNGILESRHK